MTDDGVERRHDDDGGQDDVEDVNGQSDGVSSRWDVILEEHLLLSRRGQQRRVMRTRHHALIQNLNTVLQLTPIQEQLSLTLTITITLLPKDQ